MDPFRAVVFLVLQGCLPLLAGIRVVWTPAGAAPEGLWPPATCHVASEFDCSAVLVDMGAATAALPDEGPEQDIVRLFDLHERRLFRLARRLSSTHGEAVDLVQETFLRVLRARSPMPVDPHGAEAWLVTVLVNLARDSGRHEGVRVRAASSAPPHEPRSPESEYVARLTVQDALGRLDARRRAVVVLHDIEGEPVARVAALLGIRPVTVRWHLARARRQLAVLLG